MVNAFPPGGVNDHVTRPLEAGLEAVFKQPVVLETKAGAAGAVGAQFVASTRPDGYTLLRNIVSFRASLRWTDFSDARRSYQRGFHSIAAWLPTQC